ncbi:hypothetical protein DFH07DRAFT_876169 [Mycena maculata]|uniref:Arrestin-like N-terminal domain-containing protein n=1 Tax=Mycena maculata TaxID=230809 RepID=A0AAD7NWW7_9AGAR|nr:hypothetical protein DFH07DRAFT_876169 [Mycena maculata]
MISSPPVYEAGTFLASTSSLPAYSARRSEGGPVSGSRGSTEHIFSLQDKKKKPWITLKVLSSAPTSASLPTFLEGNRIEGCVELDLSNGEKITGASVLIRGEIITGTKERDRLRFLDITIPLWPKPESSSGGRVSPGHCHWPFEINIPKDVILADPERPGVVRSYSLPQTFLERGTNASAHYYLSLQIIRGARLFREEDEVKTMFVYVPAVRPDPPSVSRQLAYQENVPIPGPEIDMDGWHSCPPVILKGKVFNNRRVEVQCVLSLAKPLSYTRGTVVPCYLNYFCPDLQALNLLCTPSAINVCLRRQVKCRSISTASGHSIATDDAEEICRAVWSPVKEEARRQETRRFEGEIHLPKSMKPSSAISHFTLKYFVIILPFKVTGFSSEDTQPLVQQEVEIATMFAKGPRARRYAPATSEPAVNSALRKHPTSPDFNVWR